MRTLLPAAAVLLLAFSPAPAQTTPPPGDLSEAPADSPAHLLVVGTRWTGFLLMDSTSDSFLGSIVKLEEQEDPIPWKVYVAWQVHPHWGLELSWERIAAKTRTRAADRHSDGTFRLTGPILSVVYVAGSRGRWTPYAQLGATIVRADFDAESWWALGYASQNDWRSLGAPDMPRHGVTRQITVENTLGLVAALGSRIHIRRGWHADVLLRYMHIETEASFREFRGGRPIPGVGDAQSIPFHNVALGAGIAHVF